MTQRTPRKTKAWSTEIGNEIVLNTGGGSQVVDNLLQSYLADMGLNRVQRPTVMRIIGHIDLGNQASATAGVLHSVSWGIAWVHNNIAAAGAGDAQIPSPSQGGVRETEWITRGTLRYKGTTGAQSSASTGGQHLGYVQFDTSQMRRQPTVDHQLCLIVASSGGAADDLTISYRFDTMLALS